MSKKYILNKRNGILMLHNGKKQNNVHFNLLKKKNFYQSLQS